MSQPVKVSTRNQTNETITIQIHSIMADDPTIHWYGIRTVYHFGTKQDGTNVFEERVVVFSAQTDEEALAKAEREADQYASANNLQRHPWLEAYHQDGDALIDGYEVWSELYESAEDLETFFQSRYEKYSYRPDP